jgi:hypothetical protein
LVLEYVEGPTSDEEISAVCTRLFGARGWPLIGATGLLSGCVPCTTVGVRGTST